MLGKRKQPCPDPRKKPVVSLPETKIVANVAFRGAMDIANIVQHFFVPTKGEFVERIHAILLSAFQTQDKVQAFLGLIGKFDGMLTGSIMVAAFCGQRYCTDIDCVVPFTCLDDSLTRSIEKLTGGCGWESTHIHAWGSSILHKTIHFRCPHNAWTLKVWMTKAGVDPREFIVDQFDFEFVRNFYSPADDVVHIACPTSLVQRRTSLDPRFNNTHTLNRIQKYYGRGFVVEFDEIAAVQAYLEARDQAILIDDAEEVEPDLKLCDACWRNILSIGHRHTIVWPDNNQQRMRPAMTIYPNIKVQC